MKQRPAFTLIEMLVVAAVFSIAFLIASTVFTNISTRQRSILVRQRISADARYVLESVARTVRLSSIDYVYYADQRCSTGHSGSPGDGPCDLSQAQKVLAIRDQSNVPTCYRLFTKPDGHKDLQTVTTASDCYGIPDDQWSTLNSEGLDVTDFSVFITPRSDPFLRLPRSSQDCLQGSSNFDSVGGVCTCHTRGTDILNCFADQQCVTTPGVTDCAVGPCVCQNADVQPQATILISTHTSSTRSGEQAQATLQTTVVSRVYQR